jgi:hypothetical protein
MCWKCRTQEEIAKPGFRDACAHCGKDLHVCLNCRFYEPGAYRDCRESVPEGVTDKERGNFCEYFQLNRAIFSSGGKSPPGSGAASDFNKLFGGD